MLNGTDERYCISTEAHHVAEGIAVFAVYRTAMLSIAGVLDLQI